MPSVPTRVARRVEEFFALDDDWARDAPPIGRSDVVFVLVMEAVGLLTLELARSAGGITGVSAPWWVQWVAVSTGALALLGRRVAPVTTGVLLAAHMFVVGVTMPVVMGQMALQVCYFVGLFSLMSWARSRRTGLLVGGLIVLFMLLWVAWQFALGSGVQDFLDSSDPRERRGVFAPIPAAVALTFIINIVYFVGALIGGQVSWRAARQRARLVEQAATIEEQAGSLRRRAVVDERLRIARELHDVVGHHVSVIGVQAAGARTVLTSDPPAAAQALSHVESSSREAVTQMRGLLGTLRSMEESQGESRGPEPGVEALPELAEERTRAGVHTAYRLVEDTTGVSGTLPTPLGLPLYRIAQEALANVSRHSSASAASVTLRVADRATRPHVELEVLDDGRPRQGSSGSGLGQLGIRERVASHQGEVEIGPRVTGGYRVRVRIPLRRSDV